MEATDQKIGFETAKLLRNIAPELIKGNMAGFTMNMVECLDLPTQTRVQKYLREKHEIHISVSITIFDKSATKKAYFYMLQDKTGEDISKAEDRYSDILNKSHQDIKGNYLNYELHDKFIFEDKFAFKTYEEALEVGLQEVLKLLK